MRRDDNFGQAGARFEVPRSVCVFLIVLGLLAYGVTAAIDVYYGQATTVSEKGRYLQAASVFLVPCFTFGFTSLCGFLFRGGTSARVTGGCVIFLLVVCYMAYSASNGIGFVATETMGATRLASARAKQAVDVNAELAKSRIETSEWLKKTYGSERRGDDKDRVLSKLAELTIAPGVIQVSPDAAIADAKAVVFSRWLGWDVEEAQIANAAWLVALLIGGKLLGPTLGFGLWPKQYAIDRWKQSPPKAHISPLSPESGRKLSKAAARDDIMRAISAGARIRSGKELSERWGVGQGTVSKWLREFRTEGLIRREADGNKRAIVGMPHINGRAFAGGGAA